MSDLESHCLTRGVIFYPFAPASLVTDDEAEVQLEDTLRLVDEAYELAHAS